MTQSEITDAILKIASSKKHEDIELEWMHYLQSKLDFPFEVEVSLYSYSKALHDGDIVKITGVEDIIDLYGMLMKIKKGRKTLYCPLAELLVVDKKSKNYKIIEAYNEWEMNG